MGRDNILVKLDSLWMEYRMRSAIVSALRGINLEIYDNSFNILYGPSGSGKTTLVNLIGLIDKPTYGRIFFDDHDVVTMSKKELTRVRLKKIGFVFQKFYLLEELTALENVLLPALAKDGFTRAVKKRAVHMLELVGLKDRMNHHPRHLSEGEKQRAAVARGLINEPKMLICDEPTASLDAENGLATLELLTKVHREKRVTIFLITHDEMQLHYADRVIYIRNGLIERETRRQQA